MNSFSENKTHGGTRVNRFNGFTTTIGRRAHPDSWRGWVDCSCSNTAVTMVNAGALEEAGPKSSKADAIGQLRAVSW